MKRISVLVALLVMATLVASAQKKTRTTAYNYLRKGKLDKAKENIDKAVEHEDTKNDAKTWFYYGNTYVQIATSQDEKYKSLDTSALDKAYDAYKKVLELDTKGDFKTKTMQDISVIANNYYTQGLNLYNAKQYEESYADFEKVIAVKQSMGSVDTAAIFAAAMSANAAGDMHDYAIEKYEELIALDYNNPAIYSELSNIYRNAEDIQKAKNTLQKGMLKYPKHPGLLFANINLLLKEEKYSEVATLMDDAIKIDPKNPSLYFVKGQSLEKMGDLENAKVSYEKALEVKPDFTDALYNLGAMYYNQGADINAKANELPLDAEAEYERMSKEANGFFLKAQPYFEQLYKMDPDENLKNSLKQIYSKTKQNEKILELK